MGGLGISAYSFAVSDAFPGLSQFPLALTQISPWPMTRETLCRSPDLFLCSSRLAGILSHKLWSPLPPWTTASVLFNSARPLALVWVPLLCSGLQPASRQWTGITLGLPSCLLFLSGHDPMLPVVQCVAASISDNWSSFLVFQSERGNLISLTPPWLETELHLLFFPL